MIFFHHNDEITFFFPTNILNNPAPYPLNELFTELLQKKNYKKHIYMFSTNLLELGNKLRLFTVTSKENPVEENVLFKIEKFGYLGKIYFLKVYLRAGTKKQLKKALVIKDLDILGIETNRIKEEPENFIKFLNNIKEEYKVDVNTIYRLGPSSIALQIFKLNFPEKFAMLARLPYEIDAFIRKSYIGGRNEVYKPISNAKSYYYAVNSLYPYIMKTAAMPVGKPIYCGKEYFESPNFNITDFYGFMDVHITIPEGASPFGLPVLPYKFEPIDLEVDIYRSGDNENSNIFYAEGSFRGTYFSEEIKYALTQGYKIEKIHEGIRFERMEILFDGFVDTIYKKRVSPSYSFESSFWKNILNSLAGRFAFIVKKTVRHFLPPKEGEEEYIHGGPDDPAFINTYLEFICYNVAISSAISAYARIFMHTCIIRSINNYNNLLYMETDGIFVSEPLPPHLVTTSKEIGKFRLISENTEAIFISGKFYLYKTKDNPKYTTTMRGIPIPYELKNPYFVINMFKDLLKEGNMIKPQKDITIAVPVILNGKKKATFQSTFIHKRKIIIASKINDLIETEPWLIVEEAKHQALLEKKMKYNLYIT